MSGRAIPATCEKRLNTRAAGGMPLFGMQACRPLALQGVVSTLFCFKVLATWYGFRLPLVQGVLRLVAGMFASLPTRPASRWPDGRESARPCVSERVVRLVRCWLDQRACGRYCWCAAATTCSGHIPLESRWRLPLCPCRALSLNLGSSAYACY